MNKFKKMPVSTKILFITAICLLMFTTVGGASAALKYFSETYASQFNMRHIGITLNENGTAVSSRNYNVNKSATDVEGKWVESSGVLLSNMLKAAGDKQVVLGKPYPEALSVTITSSKEVEHGIVEYVRVTVRKYWVDPEGNEVTGDKKLDLKPEYIMLHYTPVNGWIIDPEFTEDKHPERTVLYYTKPLNVNETTPDFTDTITISTEIPYTVEQTVTTDENGYKTYFTKYKYDGYQFVIEAEADGVQTHNAEDAILSAWGRRVSIAADGTLSLK
jgi:hypothetical protein